MYQLWLKVQVLLFKGFLRDWTAIKVASTHVCSVELQCLHKSGVTTALLSEMEVFSLLFERFPMTWMIPIST